MDAVAGQTQATVPCVFLKNLGAISLQVSKCGAQKLEERGRDLSLIENPFDHNYLKKRYKQHYMSIRHQNQLEGSLPKKCQHWGQAAVQRRHPQGQICSVFGYFSSIVRDGCGVVCTQSACVLIAVPMVYRSKEASIPPVHCVQKKNIHFCFLA